VQTLLPWCQQSSVRTPQCLIHVYYTFLLFMNHLWSPTEPTERCKSASTLETREAAYTAPKHVHLLHYCKL
jgi:hypothetical protein